MLLYIYIYSAEYVDTNVSVWMFFLEAPSYHNKAWGNLPMACDSLDGRVNKDGTVEPVMYLQGWRPVSESTIKQSGRIGALIKEHIYIYISSKRICCKQLCVEREACVLF